MKKIFGVQAEFNITADEEIVHGIGKGIQNGSVAIMDIFNEVKPAVSDCIKRSLAGQTKDNDDCGEKQTTDDNKQVQKVLFVEDGSVDLDDLKDLPGVKVVVHRKGTPLPQLVDMTKEM